MKAPKKKKLKKEDEEDDGRRVPFTALEALTTSDVIEQVKLGMSHIAPLELEERDDDGTSY